VAMPRAANTLLLATCQMGMAIESVVLLELSRFCAVPCASDCAVQLFDHQCCHHVRSSHFLMLLPGPGTQRASALP
jgi:hypothetical protein